MPPPPPAATIAVRAAACNNQARGRNAPLPIDYLRDGARRLVRLCIYWNRLMHSHAVLGDWDRVLEYLARFAVELRDGVFRAQGADTAALVVVSLLGDMGFRPQGIVALRLLRDQLAEAIMDGDDQAMVGVVRAWYDPPA